MSVAGRLALTVNGTRYATWTAARITRDLRDITGHFELRYYDAGRAAAAYPATAPAGVPPPILRRQSCQIALDGELVLDGWIVRSRGEREATSRGDDVTGSPTDRIEASIVGCDRTIDLADCTACPTGPAEWRNATLMQIAQQVCAPFGIKATAQTDVGAPFPRVAVNVHESALSGLEKAARQRGLLMLSDGVGGLLFTTGGRTAAPGSLIVGQNCQLARWEFDDSRRFSDIYIKGQSEKAAGHRPAGGPPLGHDYVPGPVTLPPWAVRVEAAGILMTGHAVDPEVTRYRPSVRFTRTQSGGATQQEQAEWAVRVARGNSIALTYTVLDWRANGVLWRPNTTVQVLDPYAGIDDMMLIRDVCYRIGPDGDHPSTPVTEIGVVGLTAFDRVDRKATHVRLRRHVGNA